MEGCHSATPVVDPVPPGANHHFNGWSTSNINGDRPTGESYTIAHHLFTPDRERKIMTASLRYLDRFVRPDEAWFFEERHLILDWSETRGSTP